MNDHFRKPVDSGRVLLEPEIITSRRALIDVIIGLSGHHDALTVLGVTR